MTRLAIELELRLVDGWFDGMVNAPELTGATVLR
jgi:hypothetical protein